MGWLSEVGRVHFEHVLVVAARCLLATLLGAVVAYRPWRALLRDVPPVARETAQAQSLIAMAGSVMVSIIGDSQALAFGLVGLGGFIRFRSGIKDTRDAAVMFVMIGVGMACGLGNLGLAVAAAGFAVVVLGFFDAFGTSRPRRVQVAIVVDDPNQAFPHIREAFRGSRVIALPTTQPVPGRIVLEIDASPDVDAASVLAHLQSKGVTGVKNVSFEED
jgi:uncharacterized membrane protein YhiD involved in acid resistance